jgi:hypothetical protein
MWTVAGSIAGKANGPAFAWSTGLPADIPS